MNDILKDIMVPITYETVCDLKPGEWIWDNKFVHRRAHEKSLNDKMIFEPYGFRQIDILDLEMWPRWSNKPFMLTCSGDATRWVYFENNRFWRFKKPAPIPVERASEENSPWDEITDLVENKYSHLKGEKK